MSKRFKPKVRLTTESFRIVDTASSYGQLEMRDGRERMNVQRWRDLRDGEISLDRIIREIGKALAKRKRARRKP